MPTFLAFALAGCQSASAPAPASHPAVVVNSNNAAPDSAARPSQIEQAIGADPNSARLQEFSGALLDYFAGHQRLPVSLAELRSLPDLDLPDAVSPVSGKPYVYLPGGLRSPIDTRQIVMYDAMPDAAGFRCVVLLRPARAGTREAPATWVARLPETEFRQFAP